MISIIICTRNRINYLTISLISILNQNFTSCPFEIIVVDNNSTDSTPELVKMFSKKYNSKIKYVLEPTIGLSFARNSAIVNSKYEYLVYLDDDGFVQDDFLSQVYNVILTFGFVFFGGWFRPFYLNNKPGWIHKDFGSYPRFLDEIGVLPVGKDIPGGIMVIKKDVLKVIGGFPEFLGMRGDSLGYGEENYVQDRIRELGYSIGFVPSMILDHFVPSYKQKVSWHLMRFYSLGRDKSILKNFWNFNFFIILLTKSLIYPIPLFLFNFKKLILLDEYYFENWILDSLEYPLRFLGSSIGLLVVCFKKLNWN